MLTAAAGVISMAGMLIYAWKPRLSRSRLLAAALSCLAVLPGGVVQAQNWVWGNREMAKTAAMHDIALIQASAGDFQGAKRTVSQISEDGEKIPAEVTVVSFCNGHPIYHCPSPGCGGPPPMAAASAAVHSRLGGAIHTETNTSSLSIGCPIACRPSSAGICRQRTWIPIRVTAQWSTSPMSGTPMARA